MTDAKTDISADGLNYLIRKQGYYYRPNSQGYTCSAIQAGRYTRSDAESITHPNGQWGPRDGMSFHHEDDVVDDDWMLFRNLRQALTDAEAKIASMTPAPDAELDALVADLAGYTSVIPRNASNTITAMRAHIAALTASLSDPISVHANMLRGQIAMPSFANIKHLYADDFAALTAERDALASPPPWDDRDDEMSPAILQSHPAKSKDYTSYTAALELVSNRHSKGSLVALVCHLLRMRDAAEYDAERLASALIWCSGSDDFNSGGKARIGWLKLGAPALAAHAARKGASHE